MSEEEQSPSSDEVATHTEETVSVAPSQSHEPVLTTEETHTQQQTTAPVEPDAAPSTGSGASDGAHTGPPHEREETDETEPSILIEPATSGEHPPPELPSLPRDRAPTNTSALADERMVAYDSPTMISDLETQLQFFIRPEFQLLEILCHVNGFVEDTTYLFLDLGKLMLSIHSAEETPAPSRKAALVDFILPRLALKSDDVDLNRMKLIMYLQPFQKHTFTGEFGHEVSSSKFKEPPLFLQVIVDQPTGLDLTPWPTTIDSASLRAAETYLNHFHGTDGHDAGSRRTSVRSSLFAKAWLGPNSPLQMASSTRPSVMVIDAHLHGGGGGGGGGDLSGGEELISPTRLGSISMSSANSTGPLSLPKINKAGSISVDHSLNSSLNSRHADDLQSPSSVAASLASSLFPTAHSNNSNSNGSGNTTASFLPRFAKDAPSGEKHIYDFLMSNESRCDSARLPVDGADQQQQPPPSSSAAAHHVTMLPPLDDGHYAGSPLVAASAQNSARKRNRDRVQRRSLGNATFAPPSSAKLGKGTGGGGGGGPEDSPALSAGSVKSVSGSPSRLLRRSFGMDPIQARSLESEKFGATLPKLAPIAAGNGGAVAAPTAAAAAAPSL
eukprot:gene6618-4768_t